LAFDTVDFGVQIAGHRICCYLRLRVSVHCVFLFVYVYVYVCLRVHGWA
jgi:hypothetical protein